MLTARKNSRLAEHFDLRSEIATQDTLHRRIHQAHMVAALLTAAATGQIALHDSVLAEAGLLLEELIEDLHSAVTRLGELRIEREGRVAA